MGEETSYAPHKRAMRGTPRRYIKNNMFSRTSTPPSRSLIRPGRPDPTDKILIRKHDGVVAKEFDIFCLSRDEEVDEHGDGLEDLEVDVEIRRVMRSFRII